MEEVQALIVAVLPALLTSAGLLGLAMGAALLLFPGRIQQWGGRVNRWRSTRRAFRPLEIPITSERFIYRHNRVFGFVLLAGGIFASLRVGACMGVGQPMGAEPLHEILTNAGLVFLLVGNLAAIGIGAIVLIRPSRLKGLEAVANQWVSTRRALRGLETMDDRLDRYVLASPRTGGAVFIVVGLYLLVSASTINLV